MRPRRVELRPLADLPIVVLAVIAVGSAVGLAALAYVATTRGPGFAGIDRWAANTLTAAEDSRTLRVFEAVSFTGSVGVVALVGLVVGAGAWVWLGSWRLALICVASPALAGLIEIVLKQALGSVRSARAVAASGFEFPSGHASGTTALVIALTVVVWAIVGDWKRYLWMAALVVYGVMVALSRVVVATHYATDVIGGVLTGIAAATTVIVVVVKIPPRADRWVPAPPRRRESVKRS